MNDNRGTRRARSAREKESTRRERQPVSDERVGGAVRFDPTPEWVEALRDSLTQIGPTQGVKMRPGPC